MKEIPLTRGYVALVDDEDYEGVSQHKWTASVRKKKSCIKVYAVRYLPLVGGRRPTIYMHREILGLDSRGRGDHRDGNGLNNQRHNLRPATVSQNNANRGKHRKGSSKFKGVHWHKGAGTWIAKIRVDRKVEHIGCFKDEIDAATAYNLVAYERFGEFAVFNIPPWRENDRTRQADSANY